MFDGKNTVTISAWLKNQTGSGNYAAMFFGNDKNSNGFPTQYWLLNPANLSGQMKSVITNSVNESAPYNTEYPHMVLQDRRREVTGQNTQLLLQKTALPDTTTIRRSVQ